ncbi:hypothetical protein SADUNF_Sadunf04G0109200 [Salix dunnii]|uniref:Uncharacterized protein n=1 Tax=Salix dunnii TaxID=1413687 RepID=A0A835N0X1_9ROSI|nr:hypothetical protein SADUNF_Sadunf04G0109200 [Salix dunnii]
MRSPPHLDQPRTEKPIYYTKQEQQNQGEDEVFPGRSCSLLFSLGPNPVEFSFPSSFRTDMLLFTDLDQFVELSDARKEPREYYWKSVMKDEPMPEAIKDLFVEDPAGAGKMNRFVKDFDTRQSAIIYHSHDEKDRLKERKSTNARDHDGDKADAQ